MAVVRPPDQLVYAIERQAPGVFRSFFAALNRAHYGLRAQVTSYWRSRADNRRVGGSSDSAHLIGLGIDLIYASNRERQAAIAAMRRQNLIVVDEGDHVHVQAWPAPVNSKMIGWLRI